MLRKSINKYEKSILEIFLELPVRKLLNHKFELEEDYLTGYVSRFLKGERFEKEFIPFSEYQLEIINSLLEQYSNTEDGKDLLTAVYITKAACNIMNKYKK